MTTQTTAPDLEQRLSSIESRLAVLEATITLFIEEQREYRRENNARLELMAERMNQIDERIDHLHDNLSGRIDHLNDNLSSRIDHSHDYLSGRIDNLSGRIDNLSDRIDNLGSHVNRILYALLGGMSAIVVAGVIAIVFG